MRPIAYRYQRTLAHTADVPGVGFISGARVRLRFRPAPAGSGIVFARADQPGTPMVPARVDSVTDTNRRTTLGSPRTGVTLVEHALAALAALHIDNCLIELDGPEPPGLDGSAWGFVQALQEAGSVLQSASRAVMSVSEPISVKKDGTCITLHPCDTSATEAPILSLTYFLDYGPDVSIPRQSSSIVLTPESFIHDIARCRTFLLESEAHALRSQGIGRHLTAAEVLVFGPQGPIDNPLRHADEPARHKILDMIGDLALCGFDIVGHIVAYRSGHALNIELAKRLSVLALSQVPGARNLPRSVTVAQAA